ncbi:MAG: sigma-70 family RNA polymerase sigma factor [Fidelibacterota bacterium]|nr:MAG: sigma-70 family RNA polymerase sigma factor [Candidatus Neomarinimicrobiota bacterium]
MDSHEQRLVHRFREGDAAAFRELVERCQEPVFQLAIELTGDWDDADDLSQQVFIKAYRALPNFRGETKIMSWLYRIMVNTHIDNARKNRALGWRINPSSPDEDQSQAEPYITHTADDNPETRTASHYMQDHINRALETLAPRQRSVFVLRHYHDLSLKEIARILGLSVGTVKSQLFRAIQRMQKELAFYKAELGLEESS